MNNPTLLTDYIIGKNVIPTYLSQRRMYIKEKSSVNVPAAHFSKMCLIPTKKQIYIKQ